MPAISARGKQMPASPIRKLVPYAEKAKAAGVQIYHLNIGQPDIKTPEVMLNAVRNFNAKVVEYSHSAGNESYRRKLTQYYQKYGIELDYSDILITTGGSEAILFGMMSCLDAGDEVIIPEPLYANYNGFSTAGNIVVKPITATIDQNFALPPIEEFEKVITPRTKAILICNPNNPTGYLYSEDELKTLREIVLKHDLYLFADEVYREFTYDGAQPLSVLSLSGLDQHAVVVDSISKRYSACGARIGALVSRNRELMATALKFAQARLSPPTFGQVLAEAGMEVPDSYFTEVNAEYTRRRNVLVEGLNNLEGVFCPMPKGAFYVVARLPIADSDHFCQWMLESFHYNGKTVMMAPATGFYATPGLGKNEVRLAYVLNEDDLRSALVCLREGLKAYPGRIAATKTPAAQN
ncbi:pyridoxal phosphate-dependent aminotransferase [Sphingobacteriales bacterium UPWRP_1]|nr:aspartate aminotransferase [Sphingobacteriales bacterium TSM_CSM]PSJ78863.1 pyridoxal phosphate-dependent aminotransferase [Sphingobacteriales bacterium UPWRP_1]